MAQLRQTGEAELSKEIPALSHVRPTEEKILFPRAGLNDRALRLSVLARGQWSLRVRS